MDFVRRSLALGLVLSSQFVVAATPVTETTFFNFESGSATELGLEQRNVLSPEDTKTNPWILFGGVNAQGKPNFPYYFNDQAWGASLFTPTQSGTVTAITLELKPSSPLLTPQQVIVTLCPKVGDNAKALVSYMSCDLFKTDLAAFPNGTSGFSSVTYTYDSGFFTQGKVTAGTPAWVLVTPGDGNFAPVAPAGSRVDVRTVPAVDATQVLSTLTGFYFTQDGVSYPFVNAATLAPISFAPATPARSFKMKGQGVLDLADASCGTANGQILNQSPTTPAQLCAIGTAGPVTTNANGEYTWLCSGRGAGKSAQCKTWNGKSNQSPLAIVSKKTVISRGGKMLLTTQGGQGTGAVSYAVNNNGMTDCSIKEQKAGGAMKIYLRAGKKIGTCAVIATKAADGAYNFAVSSAITFTIK